MVRLSALTLATLAIGVADIASARIVQKREPQPTGAPLHARQAAATGAFSAFSGTLAPSVSSIVATITSGTESSLPSATAKSTYTAGATNPSISNAPPLPDASALVIADFPPLDRIPPADFGMSAQILAKVDLSGIPDIPLTDGTCAGSPMNAQNAQANHWWTCGGWTADSDVTVCPDKNTWGLSYDDGPSPYTPQLLDYLDANNLKSTFFIVGSRALSRPDIMRYEYMTGHQLSVHTWSHPSLTNLTNQEIVLELGWTKEVIRRATGVTPNTMRPPYGDIDDRVRAICAKMDLTPIIWTSTGPNSNYDTEDWKIGAGVVSAAQVVANFENIIANSSNLDTGYIVLEHDLYKQSVELATEVVLPAAMAKQPTQSLKPIVQCLDLTLADSYIETNSNTTGSGGLGSRNTSSSTTSSSGGSSGGTSGSDINSSGGLGSGSSSGSGSSGSSGNGAVAKSALTLSAVGVTAFAAFCLL